MVEDLEGFPGIGGAEDEESVAGPGTGGAVGVLDVDVGVAEASGDGGEAAGAVVAMDHEDIALDDEGVAFLEEFQGAAGIADDHAHDTVVDGVAGGDGVDVDAGLGEGFADASERARLVVEEQGQLCRQLHEVIGYWRGGGWRGWTRGGQDLPQRRGGEGLVVLVLLLLLVLALVLIVGLEVLPPAVGRVRVRGQGMVFLSPWRLNRVAFGLMNPPTESLDVPEWLRPAMGVIGEHLPEDCVREMGRQMLGGFTKRAAILAQWRRLISGNVRLSPDLVVTLRLSMAPCRVLVQLDPAMIPTWIDALMSAVGPEATVVSLWLDPRPTVSALAKPELLTRVIVKADDREAAWRRFVSMGFLEPMGMERVSPVAAPSAAPAVGALAANDSVDLEKHRKWLKDARSQLATEVQAHQKTVREMREQSAAREAALVVERDAVKKELQELRSGYVTKVQQEVKAALDAQVRPWLARAVATEAASDSSAPEFDRIAGELRGALERQRQADRHQGNRAMLRRELEVLAELKAQAQMAAGEAIQPLGEWAALLRRAEAAIVRRRELLGDLPAEAPEWMTDLQAQLALATTPAAVASVLGRVEALAGAALLTPPVLGWFRDRAAVRKSAVSDPLRRGASVVVVRIGDVLRGAAAGVILIDAYNWIGAAGEVLGVSSDPARFVDSLRRLHPLLGRIAARASKAQVQVVADGHDSNQRTLASNLRIVWSGGEGRNRADAVLIGHLRHLRRGAETPTVFVVTNDQEIRTEATALGAMIEDSLGFARRVQAVLGEGA